MAYSTRFEPESLSSGRRMYTAFETWWHTRRSQKQHPMRGMTGREQGWRLLFPKDDVSLSSILPN